MHRLQTALRPPDSPGGPTSPRSPKSPKTGSPGYGSPSDGTRGDLWDSGNREFNDLGLAVSGDGGSNGSPVQPKSLLPSFLSDKKKREAKAEAKARKADAERKAQGALKRMMARELTRGWQTWVVAWEEACYRRTVLFNAVVAMSNLEIMKGWRQWHEWWCERIRKAEVLARAATSLANRHRVRGWRAWGEYQEWIKEERALEAALRRTAARMRNPRLLETFGFWQQEMRLAQMGERMGVKRDSGLCALLAKCVGAGSGRGPPELGRPLDPMEA